LHLQPAWQAQETYDFSKYHIKGCDREKCDGKCGLNQPKKLSKDINMRKERDVQRNDALYAIEEGPPSRKRADKMEESGDEDFVVEKNDSPRKGTPTAQKDSPRKGNTSKAKKKARVTFAE
ncbi:MAG: hypothetical protein LQ352_007273, partial [Teloschistes flavicans]